MLITRSTYHRTLHRPAALIATLGALLLALVGAPVSSAATQELVIEGGGFGHGVGMSQEGALGYAEHGFSYQQILAHYYTGTALGTAPANTSASRTAPTAGRTIFTATPPVRGRAGFGASKMPACTRSTRRSERCVSGW